MRAFATFALAWFLSLVAAQIVAQQFAIAFGNREEFILVMFIVGAFTVASLAVLTMAFIGSSGVAPVDIAGGVSMTLAILLVGGLTLYGMARNAWNWPTQYDKQILVEITVPMLLAVFIQWFLIRRYRMHHTETEPTI